MQHEECTEDYLVDLTEDMLTVWKIMRMHQSIGIAVSLYMYISFFVGRESEK